MYKKTCTRCTRSSFSSTEIGKWHCPICGNDLTEAPFYQANSYKQINELVIPLKKKLNTYNRNLK